MQTKTKQLKAMIVDLQPYTKELSNPLVKAFNAKGQVFGFTCPYIVADKLNLIFSNIDGVDYLVDNDNKTYRVVSTRDLSPAFSKGIGRNKNGINFKQNLVLSCDRVCILEKPFNGKSTLTIFKTVDLILDDRGNLV